MLLQSAQWLAVANDAFSWTRVAFVDVCDTTQDHYVAGKLLLRPWPEWLEHFSRPCAVKGGGERGTSGPHSPNMGVSAVVPQATWPPDITFSEDRH